MGKGAIAEVIFWNQVVYETCPVSRVYTAGERYGKLPKLSREGYAFKGWRDAQGETVKAKDLVRLDQQWLRAEWVALTAKFVLEEVNLLTARPEPSWCLDWYGPPAFGEDPAGTGQGTSRVKRGGSWGHPERQSTSLYRNGADSPAFWAHDGGFRLSLMAK